VIWNQGPGKTPGGGNGRDLHKSRNEIIPIHIIAENISAFDAAANDVVQRSWDVDPCLTWHSRPHH
jgi:hypothetical protein